MAGGVEIKGKAAREQEYKKLLGQKNPTLIWDIPKPTVYDPSLQLKDNDPELKALLPDPTDRYAGKDLDPSGPGKLGYGFDPTTGEPRFQHWGETDAPFTGQTGKPPAPEGSFEARMRAQRDQTIQAGNEAGVSPGITSADPNLTGSPSAVGAPGAVSGAAAGPPPQTGMVGAGQPQLLSIGGAQPGGWRSTISKPTRGLYEEAFDSGNEANMTEIGYAKQGEREAAAIQAAANDRAQKEMAQQIGTAEGQYFAQQNALKKAQDIQAEAQQETDRAMKEVREGKVDPNKFYSEKDTLTQIGLALSVGMGAYWSTLTGGPNQAMQIVDKAIDRDIRAQEVNLANKRAYADSALRRNLMATGSLERAKELTRIQLLDLTRMAAAKMALDDQSAIGEAQHAKVMSALEGSIGKAIAAHTMAYANYRRETEQYVQAQSPAALVLKQGIENAKFYVPGMGIVPEKLYQKAAESTADLANFQSIMNQLAALTGEIGQAEKAGAIIPAFKSDKMRQLDALMQEAQFIDSNAMLNQGVIREHEVEQFNQLVGSPDSIWQSPDSAQKLVGSIANRVNGKLHSMAVQYNAQPADVFQVQTPQGVQQVALPKIVDPRTLGKSAFNQPLPQQQVQLKPTLSE